MAMMPSSSFITSPLLTHQLSPSFSSFHTCHVSDSYPKSVFPRDFGPRITNRTSTASMHMSRRGSSTSNNKSRSGRPALKRSRTRLVSTGRDFKKSADSSASTVDVDLSSEERLQKVLSRLGVASRRQAESLIVDGRVSVNGKRISTLGTSVNIWKDSIFVNGKRVELPSTPLWVAFNKPKGYLCTVSGPHSISRFLTPQLRKQEKSLIPAGAISEESAGLVIYTNERGAVLPLVRPDNPHVQTWFVDCLNVATKEQIQKLNDGIILDRPNSKPILIAAILLAHGKGIVSSKERALMCRLEIRLRDSRHHVVRRLCEAVGLSVVRMARYSFGPVLLGSLPRGEFRNLQQKEIKAIKRGVSQKTIEAWNSRKFDT